MGFNSSQFVQESKKGKSLSPLPEPVPVPKPIKKPKKIKNEKNKKIST